MSEPETICYDCRLHKHLMMPGRDICVDCYAIRREQERQADELERQQRERMIEQADELERQQRKRMIERSRDIGGLSR